MSRFIRKFSIWNGKTDHYEYTNDFNEAIWLSELVYGLSGDEWVLVKESKDFYELERYLISKDIEVEVDIDKEINYGGGKR